MNIVAFVLFVISMLLTVLLTYSFFALGEDADASWEAVGVVTIWWLATAIVQGLFV